MSFTPTPRRLSLFERLQAVNKIASNPDADKSEESTGAHSLVESGAGLCPVRHLHPLSSPPKHTSTPPLRETTENEVPPGAIGLSPTDLAVIYVESSDDGVRFRPLRVDPEGEFIDRWPKGFFEERVEELF